eukprot:10157496-Lingulodinium_polyedra.AAC.1
MSAGPGCQGLTRGKGLRGALLTSSSKAAGSGGSGAVALLTLVTWPDLERPLWAGMGSGLAPLVLCQRHLSVALEALEWASVRLSGSRPLLVGAVPLGRAN